MFLKFLKKRAPLLVTHVSRDVKEMKRVLEILMRGSLRKSDLPFPPPKAGEDALVDSSLFFVATKSDSAKLTGMKNPSI